MDKDFLEENTPTQDQKFTIGDKEYTQDQLNDLISKGNQYTEIESKFNTKLDRVVPDYTRASQEAAELRSKVAEYEKERLDQKATQGNLSQEELIKRAKMEAQGIGLMTDENTPELVRREIEAYRLNDAVNSQVDGLSKMGISANPDIIKRYMSAMSGDRVDLDEAVRDLYGPQVKLFQEQELLKNKPSGLYTESGSNSGSFRLPENVKVNDGNLADLFREAIGGES